MAGSFMTSWETVSSLTRTLLHEGSYIKWKKFLNGRGSSEVSLCGLQDYVLSGRWVQHYRGTNFLHLQGYWWALFQTWLTLILKTEAVCFSETLVSTYQTVTQQPRRPKYVCGSNNWHLATNCSGSATGSIITSWVFWSAYSEKEVTYWLPEM